MTKLKLTATAVLLLVASLSAGAGEELVIIDVRSDEEYAQDHIEGALHMPYEQIGSLIDDQVQDKDAPIVVYCRSGRRSGIARETLMSLGYTNVENAGGLNDLRRAMAEADDRENCVEDC